MFNTDSIVYEELGDNEDNSKRYRIKINYLQHYFILRSNSIYPIIK